MDLKLSLSASAPESVEELREMLANMEAQLVALYDEKEHTQVSNPVAVDETLTALYEDKQRLSARTIADLQASVESLTAQLADFYEQREQGAADPNTEASLRATIAGLNEQLHSIYSERELTDYAANFPDASVATLLATVQSFEAQLAALYAEGEGQPWAHREAVTMVHSLTEQVAALLDERNDIAADNARLASDIATTKRRAREMVDAIVAQSLG